MKCPIHGGWLYAVFYLPYGKNKYNYCPECDKEYPFIANDETVRK